MEEKDGGKKGIHISTEKFKLIHFGDENVKGFAQVVKFYLQENLNIKVLEVKESPIIKSKFKKMQETGLEAELYFLNNYQSVDIFKGGTIEDARLYGDGYDFQINVRNRFLLAEVKGIRENSGRIRLTENEYVKASKYKADYILSVVLNLNEIPKLKTINNPTKNLEFKKVAVAVKTQFEYQLISSI